MIKLQKSSRYELYCTYCAHTTVPDTLAEFDFHTGRYDPQTEY
jgi:hypothetical protein